MIRVYWNVLFGVSFAYVDVINVNELTFLKETMFRLSNG